MSSGDGPDSLASFDTEPDTEFEGEPDGEPEPGSEPFLTKPRGTVLGVVLALAITGATLLAARNLLADVGVTPGTGETVAVGLIGFVVALAGFVPFRWGLWVVPMVSAAHYALNFYNMLFTEQSVYQFVPGSALGYAVLTPAIGVALGWLFEGVYRLVAPE